MDPDAALAEMLDLARTDQSEFNDDIHRLAELTLALHGWLEKGGHLPAAWVLARTRIAQGANYLPSERNR